MSVYDTVKMLCLGVNMDNKYLLEQNKDPAKVTFEKEVNSKEKGGKKNG